MNPKNLGNLFALTTTIGLSTSVAFAKPAPGEPTPQDQIDAYCTHGVLVNNVDKNVCDADTIAWLIAQIQANVANSSTPDEINQGGGQQVAKLIDLLQ